MKKLDLAGKEHLISVLKDLVSINSINPALDVNSPGEVHVADYIFEMLKSQNLNPEKIEVSPGRPNVVCVIPGFGDGPSLMINAHTDTVGILGFTDAFQPRIEDGKLFARGAVDMKGSIAAILSAVKMLQEDSIKLDGDLILAFVVDEEYGSLGTKYLLDDYSADGVIVTEPTDLNICISHKGFGLYEFSTKGKAAHGGTPDLGIDANMHMALIANQLSNIDFSTRHHILGSGSLHIPLIEGGTEVFTYSSECKMQVERRTVPGENARLVSAEFDEILGRLSKKIKGFNAKYDTILWRDAFEGDQKGFLAQCVKRTTAQILGREPAFIGHNWWEDSGLTSASGMDTVVFGPRGGGLHTPDEWVDLDSLYEMSLILYHTITAYCNESNHKISRNYEEQY